MPSPPFYFSLHSAEIAPKAQLTPQADYEISLDGNTVLRSKGKAMKLYDEKTISRPSGEVFRIKTTSIVPKAFSCYDAQGERFTVKSKLMSCE